MYGGLNMETVKEQTIKSEKTAEAKKPKRSLPSKRGDTTPNKKNTPDNSISSEPMIRNMVLK